MVKRVAFLTSVLGLAVVVGSSPVAGVDRSIGATVSETGSPVQQGGQGMQMGMPMQDMMKMHEKMMADMKTSQAKLDDLVKRMNSSTGEARVNAMAELLNELVRGHRTMGDHMSTMHQHMMKMGK